MGHCEFLELNYGLDYKAQDSGFHKEKLARNSGIRVTLQGTNGKNEKDYILYRLLSSYQRSTHQAVLHGSSGPQVGEVTRLGGVTRLSM